MIILNGLKVNSVEDFHKEIAKLLGFGPYYGRNLDALWDMMSTGMGDYYMLYWNDYEYSREKIGDAEFNKIISIFDEVIKFDEKVGNANFGFNYFLVNKSKNDSIY